MNIYKFGNDYFASKFALSGDIDPRGSHLSDAFRFEIFSLDGYSYTNQRTLGQGRPRPHIFVPNLSDNLIYLFNYVLDKLVQIYARVDDGREGIKKQK